LVEIISHKEKRMKKFPVFAPVGAVLLALVGCGNTEPAPAGLADGVPQFVNDAYLNASEDVPIGIGTYEIGADVSKMSTGMTIAQTRARADIARQLLSAIKNMIPDYTATNEPDLETSLFLLENVKQSLAGVNAELRDAKVIASRTDTNGLLWVVMEYSRSAAAAKLTVPAAVTFDALERMDAAFDKAAGGAPAPVNE
jgi:hypothetical protein